jgi:hypothetical protein
MSPQAFPERVLAHQRLELSHELAVAAGCQLGSEAGLESAEVLLPESDGHGRQAGARSDAGERVAPPQRHRLAQVHACLLDRSAPQRLLTPLDQGSEPADVDVLCGRAQHVPGCRRTDDLRAQRATHVGDVGLQRLASAGRRRVAPQRVDEAVEPHDLTGTQRQCGQQGPFLRSPEDDLA